MRWPVGQAWQKEAFELKVWANGRSDPLKAGLAQLDGYLDKLGLDGGTLVLFDRREAAPPWETRVSFDAAISPAGRTIRIIRA